MRIGVLGGSFDPPHAAHAALARSARASLSLDTVLWIPTFSPPHKGLPAASFDDRMAMTQALTAQETGSEASDIEATLPAPSYTVHTLAALRARHGEGHAWYLLLGADNWKNFPNWHQPEAVLAAAEIAVYPRAGFPLDINALPTGVTLLDFPEMPDQSTDYRAWLARDRDAALAALPAPVADVIRTRVLYRTDRARVPA